MSSLLLNPVPSSYAVGVAAEKCRTHRKPGLLSCNSSVASWIETATRQRMHDEYAARLAAASGQVRAMVAEIDLLSHQLTAVRQDLAGTRRVAGQAEAAFNAGNLDERSYVDLVAARLTKEQEVVTIEQSLLDQQVAIATLIGEGMPAIAIPSGDTPE